MGFYFWENELGLRKNQPPPAGRRHPHGQGRPSDRAGLSDYSLYRAMVPVRTSRAPPWPSGMPPWPRPTVVNAASPGWRSTPARRPTPSMVPISGCRTRRSRPSAASLWRSRGRSPHRSAAVSARSTWRCGRNWISTSASAPCAGSRASPRRYAVPSLPTWSSSAKTPRISTRASSGRSESRR